MFMQRYQIQVLASSPDRLSVDPASFFLPSPHGPKHPWPHRVGICRHSTSSLALLYILFRQTTKLPVRPAFPTREGGGRRWRLTLSAPRTFSFVSCQTFVCKNSLLLLLRLRAVLPEMIRVGFRRSVLGFRFQTKGASPKAHLQRRLQSYHIHPSIHPSIHTFNSVNLAHSNPPKPSLKLIHNLYLYWRNKKNRWHSRIAVLFISLLVSGIINDESHVLVETRND